MSMTPRIQLECGPIDDIRTLEIKLSMHRKRIGVLVSGGLDSALLYYLIQSIATEDYTVTPFTISRNDGSDVYAQPVIDYVNSVLNKPKQKTTILSINESDNNLQVVAGIKEIHKQNVNITYIGIIETLPIHCIGVFGPYYPTDRTSIKYPMKDLNKSHIVDIVCKLNQSNLFNLTHSCVYERNRCGICNRCNERSWAFTRLGLTDPGNI